jgi:hypothetical protein
MLLLFRLHARQRPDLRRVDSSSRNSRPGRAAILNCGIGTAAALGQGGGPAADGPRNKSAYAARPFRQFVENPANRRKVVFRKVSLRFAS